MMTNPDRPGVLQSPSVRHHVGSLLEFPEWRMLREHRPNVMLCGSKAPIRLALRGLLGTAWQAVETWDCTRPLCLPRPESAARSYIIEEAGLLSPDSQARLADWMMDVRGTQIVTTILRPLFPQVEAGSFQQTLYYRLNVVYLELPPADDIRFQGDT